VPSTWIAQRHSVLGTRRSLIQFDAWIPLPPPFRVSPNAGGSRRNARGLSTGTSVSRVEPAATAARLPHRWPKRLDRTGLTGSWLEKTGPDCGSDPAVALLQCALAVPRWRCRASPAQAYTGHRLRIWRHPARRAGATARWPAPPAGPPRPDCGPTPWPGRVSHLPDRAGLLPECRRSHRRRVRH
jgi:hypothetical protein